MANISAEAFSIEFMKKMIGIIDAIDIKSVVAFAHELLAARERESRIYFAGNGGSLSIATHFACDLGKGVKEPKSEQKPFRVLALDNMAWISAQANDGHKYFLESGFPGTYAHGYDGVFVGQLENQIEKNDLLVVISSSGNSQNVVNALLYAKDRQAKTVSLTGFDGGQCAEIADLAIVVRSEKGEYGIVESAHEVIHHLIYEYMRSLK